MPDRFQQLKDLYELIPNSNCKGLCQDSCGPIMMEPVEEQHIRSIHPKVVIPDPLKVIQSEDLTCPLLKKNGQCLIYNERPAICRMWGSVEKMPCTHGCTPDSVMSTQGSHFVFECIENL